jgi:hypothetical protein
MAGLLELVRARWTASGLGPSRGASATEIAALEARYSVRLSPEVREYFAELNGPREGRDAMDNDTIAWWRLDEVRSLLDEGDGDLPDAGNCFVFADYLIRSHDFAIRLGPDPRAPAQIVINCGHPLIQAAPSLPAFLEGYLRTDWDILTPCPPGSTSTG